MDKMQHSCSAYCKTSSHPSSACAAEDAPVLWVWKFTLVMINIPRDNTIWKQKKKRRHLCVWMWRAHLRWCPHRTKRPTFDNNIHIWARRQWTPAPYRCPVYTHTVVTLYGRFTLIFVSTADQTQHILHIVRVHIWYARGLSRFFFSFFFCYCFVFFLFLLCLDIPYLPAYFAQHITYPALISCDIRTITAPATHTDTYERHENGIRTHAYVKRTCVVGGMAFLYASSLSLSKCIYTNNTYSAHDEV